MQSQEESLRSQIALGWALEVAVVIIMLLFMTIESILMDDSFRSLRVDPGRGGLAMMTYLLGLYVLMPVYVNLVHGLKVRLFRWIAVVVAILGFIYFLLHHLSHIMAGQRPGFTSHVLDLLLHAVSLWVIVNSIRWARFKAGTV